MTAAAQQRVLWGAGTPRTLRPRWALRELGLSYRSEAIVPRSEAMQRPDFRKVSRRGKVPILQDGGVVMGESAAIVLYLAERYRGQGHPLGVPQDDFEARAAYYDAAFFITTELDATSLYIVRRHEGLPQVYGEAPVAVQSSREYFLRGLSHIEERLSDGRPYLLGEDFRAPDLLLTTCIDWARAIGIELPAVFGAYRERIAARPAYSLAMDENYAPLRELGG